MIYTPQVFMWKYMYLNQNMHHQMPTQWTNLHVSLPYTHGLVIAPTNNVLPTMWPCHTAHIMCMALKHPHLLPCSNLLYTYSTVTVPTDNEPLIRTQWDAAHTISVPLQCAPHCGLSPRNVKIPDDDSPVPACTEKQGCFGVEHNRW
jgi:hypothetical protein